jgi:GrpB-like predicted nucleotidyltransferase (UPF0157 family)
VGSADKYPAERLAVPDAAWERRYAEVSADLVNALGPEWVVEHVGSTSVPGLVAKPVIDLALRLPEDCELSDACTSLLRAGWSAPVVIGDHWATYLLNDAVRVAIGHIFSAGQWADAHVRVFADWLRDHPEDRDRYGHLKEALVTRGTWGSEYTAGKASLVLEIVNRARESRGLPLLEGPL